MGIGFIRIHTYTAQSVGDKDSIYIYWPDPISLCSVQVWCISKGALSISRNVPEHLLWHITVSSCISGDHYGFLPPMYLNLLVRLFIHRLFDYSNVLLYLVVDVR